SDSLKDEPFLISYLVRIACLNIGVQAIWEGLAEHRWTDAQLQAIEARLQQYDFVADVKHPLDCERAAGILTAELLYRNRYNLKGIHLSDLVNEPSDDAPSALAANFFARLAPHGWYYQEQKNYCRLDDTEGMFDTQARKIFPENIAAHERELQREVGGGRLGKTLS